MLAYYFNLALRSFRRNKVLTALMVLAIALGIGASMTTLTVFYVLSGDPIPSRSDTLFYPRLDPLPMDGYQPGDEPPEQMTRFDAETLLREKRGDRQAVMSGGNVPVEPTRNGVSPFNADARYTSGDFFAMFDVPFAHGGGWSEADDNARARVAVLSKEMNEKLFGGRNSVGETVRLAQNDFRVAGVLAEWRPTPIFYDLTNDRYGDTEQVFLPFATALDLNLATRGSTDCWARPTGPEGAHGVNAPCTWLQYWVELGSPEKVEAYRAYLANYSEQQRAAGRFERPTNIQLHGLMEWMDVRRVVPRDVQMQTWLAFGFLLVCVVNTVGLLLAKFMRRSGEIGVRRALGASRGAIFAQCLVEAGNVGLAGGALGLGLAWLGLWAVRQQPTSYAELAQLDPLMLLTTFVLALVASLFAGVLPAWHACQVTPAIQLKSQ